MSASPEPQGMEQAVKAMWEAMELRLDNFEATEPMGPLWMSRNSFKRCLEAALPFLPPASLPDVEAAREENILRLTWYWEKSIGKTEQEAGRTATEDTDALLRAVVAPLEAKVELLQNAVLSANDDREAAQAAHQTLRGLVKEWQDAKAKRARNDMCSQQFLEMAENALLNYPEATND